MERGLPPLAPPVPEPVALPRLKGDEDDEDEEDEEEEIASPEVDEGG